MGVTNPTHSTRPRSRLYPDIPRPDAPVIYTGAFPILTAWPGLRLIYNICKAYINVLAIFLHAIFLLVIPEIPSRNKFM